MLTGKGEQRDRLVGHAGPLPGQPPAPKVKPAVRRVIARLGRRRRRFEPRHCLGARGRPVRVGPVGLPPPPRAPPARRLAPAVCGGLQRRRPRGALARGALQLQPRAHAAAGGVLAAAAVEEREVVPVRRLDDPDCVVLGAVLEEPVFVFGGVLGGRWSEVCM
jgi:hypothetical protein